MHQHSKVAPARLHARSWSTPVRIVVSTVIAAFAFGIGVAVPYGLEANQPAARYANYSSPEPRNTPPPPPPETVLEPPGPITFTFVAAGDVLPHSGVVNSARTSGGFNFGPMFAGVTPYIAGADLAICHMEVPVHPDGVTTAGFPRFAAPEALVRDLGVSGWNGCTTASNHSVDKGFDGLTATLNAMDKYRMGHHGTARTLAEANNAQIYNIRDDRRTIKVASISWTFSTNGLPRPSGKSWSVNVFSRSNQAMDGLIKQANAARAAGADVVIASIHCCVEYVTSPTGEQQRIAESIAASGAVDLLVGHHAHVPQSIQLLPGGPHGEGMWVAHGLGNFVSNQNPSCCSIHSTSGLMITTTFTVELDGTVHTSTEWTAVTVDRSDGHKIYALNDILGGTKGMSASEAKARYERVKSVVGPDAKERTTPVESFADSTYYEQRKPWAAGD